MEVEPGVEHAEPLARRVAVITIVGVTGHRGEVDLGRRNEAGRIRRQVFERVDDFKNRAAGGLLIVLRIRIVWPSALPMPIHSQENLSIMSMRF